VEEIDEKKGDRLSPPEKRIPDFSLLHGAFPLNRFAGEKKILYSKSRRYWRIYSENDSEIT
jgi:hypothetical protein